MADLIHRNDHSTQNESPTLQTESETTSNLSKSAAFALLQTALSIFKEVAGKVPVPGLQEGLKGLVIILDVLQVRLTSHP